MVDAVRDNAAEKPAKKGICRNCGGEGPHNTSICSAKDNECQKCSKLSHFARLCRFVQAVAQVQRHDRRRCMGRMS